MAAEPEGRVLAFVRSAGWRPAGLVLMAEPPFDIEIQEAGNELSEHDVPRAPREGLLVFSGWLRVDHGDNPDVSWIGEWREMTEEEAAAVRSGTWPFAG